MIAAVRARQSSSNHSDDDEDSSKMKDSANIALDSVRKKKRERGAMLSMRCWKCNRKGHKCFECPHREKRKKRGVELLMMIDSTHTAQEAVSAC